ncbi:MAG TPA: alpha/beta fold hydrolase [Mycobacterium sp.]|nr:alpha/beta fold hydrolase [Mycobacterium sp.]
MNDENLYPALGQQIRVDIRWGTGTPLVLCNGIGASLEVLDPLVRELDPDTTVVRFDAPGCGGSPDSPFPYRFPYLAAVLAKVLRETGVIDHAAGRRQVDVLGLSWGGGLAQQFALQNPHRCRRLILVSTGTGSLMIPARPSVLAKMLTARRFLDHRYAARIAPEIYGGSARRDPLMIKRLFDRQLMAGSRVGYLHQLMAGAGWTSLPMLPFIRQPTLIVAGTDDPIIPLVNARIMHRLLPHSALHIHSGGHVELVADAHNQARVIEEFRRRS